MPSSRTGSIAVDEVTCTVRDCDVTRHAEIIALSEAQKAISREQFCLSTLYSNIEPCAMCSYCIREVSVGRIVYALASPVIGGLSKWNILRDDEMSDRMPQVFGAVPEVVSGILVHEAQQVWRDWSPLAWQMIKLRGLLTEPCARDYQIRVRPACGPSLWQRFQILLARAGRSRIESKVPDVSPLDL
jgi:tRNA(adenine34) deaminase